MAKGPDDIVKRAASVWNKVIDDEEARIDKELEDKERLPVEIALTSGLDAEQKGELVRRYKAAGWRARIEHYASHSDDPREHDHDALVLAAS